MLRERARFFGWEKRAANREAELPPGAVYDGLSPSREVMGQEEIERLKAEVRLARRVSHPNVCRVYDIGEVDGQHYLFTSDTEFKAMVEAVRVAEKALGQVSYRVTDKEQASRVFRRSLFVVQDMTAGDVFTEDNVRSIRPGYGLHTRYLGEILGRRAARATVSSTRRSRCRPRGPGRITLRVPRMTASSPMTLGM